MNTNPQADLFFQKKGNWHAEYQALRKIVLDCQLDEDYKWMHPCYTLEGNNIVLIHGFKQYCALLFFKGALLKDTEGLLIQQTENVQERRQLRFISLTEIENNKQAIKNYIIDAIAVEKSGAKFELKKTSEFHMAEEFQNALDEMPELKTAFEKLTPGRQRGYLLYFAAAKKAETRLARIEKYVQKILDGKGLED